MKLWGNFSKDYFLFVSFFLTSQGSSDFTFEIGLIHPAKLCQPLFLMCQWISQTKSFSVYGTVQRYERGYKETGHNEIKMALIGTDVFWQP